MRLLYLVNPITKSATTEPAGSHDDGIVVLCLV